MPRSPFLLAIAPAVAVGAGGVRWAMQGSGNVYTAVHKRFYVPDPDLGWRVQAGGPVWLGLEVLAILGAITVGVLGAAWLIRRWGQEARRTSALGAQRGRRRRRAAVLLRLRVRDGLRARHRAQTAGRRDRGGADEASRAAGARRGAISRDPRGQRSPRR
jgi:hypothetical protein